NDRDKLFSPPAANRIKRSGVVDECLCDHLQDFVPGVVAVEVINILEEVDIDEQDPERPAVSEHLGDPRIQAHLDIPSVRQSCKVVEDRHLLKLFYPVKERGL